MFGTYEEIQEFLNQFRNKEIADYTEQDLQNLSLAHRQNKDQALSIQLQKELSMPQSQANTLAHYSCKLISTYLQLFYLKATKLSYSMWYLAGKNRKWWSESNPGFMNVKTVDILKELYPQVTYNQIDLYEDFLASDKFYYQIRIKVIDEGGDYDHSIPVYNVGDGKRIADVSYRTPGDSTEKWINKNNFLYASYLL